MSKSLSERLHKEADVLGRIQSFDGPYEAEEAAVDASKYREIAAALDAKDALLREARAEFRSLMLAYVNLMEIGRDRIISLGGNCDPVDVMERGDPALVKARSLLLKLTEATK